MAPAARAPRRRLLLLAAALVLAFAPARAQQCTSAPAGCTEPRPYSSPTTT
jgi:hypothetical protein